MKMQVGAKDQHPIRLLTHLINAGLLPPLAPEPTEQLDEYLLRLKSQDLPWEKHYQLDASLTRLGQEVNQNAFLLSATSTSCEAYSTPRLRKRLNKLHPRFFGSLMVHLSKITQNVWPVYTVRDALHTAEYLRYGHDDWGEQGFDAYWKGIGYQLREDEGITPERDDLKRAASEQGLPPRGLFNLIGIDEVLPALKKKLRLSLEELNRLAVNFPEAVEILTQLHNLKRLNERITAAQDSLSQDYQQNYGEMRLSPLAILSGQKTKGPVYQHEVQELLEEEWQLAAQAEGFHDNVVFIVHDIESAQNARELLPLFQESYELTLALVEILIKNEE